MTYKCICGFKTSSKVAMETHMRGCSRVRSKASVSDGSSDSFLTPSLFDSCCSSSSDYSSSSSSDSYSGGGGSFDGGGSSGDW